MTDQTSPTPVPGKYNECQLSAVTEQPTTKRIMFDVAGGEPFWVPPFRHVDSPTELPPTYQAGQRVGVHVNGAPKTGIIDMVMPDGALLWVWLDGGAGRRLLASDDPTFELLNPNPLRAG